MEKEIVDVILPNFNKEKYLEEAIQSVLDQSYKNWKLYIIDDCSNDNSIAVLDKFKNHKDIIIKLLSKNKGPSFCRNLGLRISSSEYIAFIDSDDYWKKDKLNDQINFMKENNFRFTYTDYTPFIQKNDKKKILKPTNIIHEFNLKKFTLNSSINTTTMILSRSLIGYLKFKKIKKLEDYLFKCEILKKGFSAHKQNSNSAFYRILGISRSSNKIKNLFYLWKINRKYLNYNFIINLLSIIMITINSLKKYGLK